MRTSKDEVKNKQRHQEKETMSRKLVQTVVFQDKNVCSKKTTETAKNNELV